MKHFNLRQVVEGAVLALLGLTVLLFIPAQVKEIAGMGTQLSPSFFPYLVSISLLLIGAIIVAQGLFLPVKEEPARVSGSGFRRAGIATLLLLAYVMLFPRLGFVTASGLFVGLYAWFFGARHPGGIALLMVAVPVAVWLFFERLFQIPLPHGMLF